MEKLPLQIHRKPIRIIAFLLCFVLAFEQTGFAQVAAQIDIAGHLASLHSSISLDKFRPLHLRYLSYDGANNNFKLLLDKGDADIRNSAFRLNHSLKAGFQSMPLQQETKLLLNYFFIGLSLPNSSFWVNLRPDSPDNIIDEELAKTDLGKVLLEADLELKKDTAKLTSPETALGRSYWSKLYKRAEELFGSENITIPTLTRPWIVPAEIILRESKSNAYIYKATLKVMLEEDYLKAEDPGNSAFRLNTGYSFNDPRLKALNAYAAELARELIIPKLNKAVNSSKRYSALRQVYYSLILAQWFKARFKSESPTPSLRARHKALAGESISNLIDSKNLTNLTSRASWDKDIYFNEYQKSFKDGEYHTQETVYTPTGQAIRSYTSGGMSLAIEFPAQAPQPKEIIQSAASPVVDIGGNPNRDLALALGKELIGAETDGEQIIITAPGAVLEAAEAAPEPASAASPVASPKPVSQNGFLKNLSIGLTFLWLSLMNPLSSSNLGPKIGTVPGPIAAQQGQARPQQPAQGLSVEVIAPAEKYLDEMEISPDKLAQRQLPVLKELTKINAQLNMQIGWLEEPTNEKQSRATISDVPKETLVPMLRNDDYLGIYNLDTKTVTLIPERIARVATALKQGAFAGSPEEIRKKQKDIGVEPASDTDSFVFLYASGWNGGEKALALAVQIHELLHGLHHQSGVFEQFEKGLNAAILPEFNKGFVEASLENIKRSAEELRTYKEATEELQAIDPSAKEFMGFGLESMRYYLSSSIGILGMDQYRILSVSVAEQAAAKQKYEQQMKDVIDVVTRYIGEPIQPGYYQWLEYGSAAAYTKGIKPVSYPGINNDIDNEPPLLIKDIIPERINPAPKLNLPHQEIPESLRSGLSGSSPVAGAASLSEVQAASSPIQDNPDSTYEEEGVKEAVSSVEPDSGPDKISEPAAANASPETRGIRAWALRIWLVAVTLFYAAWAKEAYITSTDIIPIVAAPVEKIARQAEAAAKPAMPVSPPIYATIYFPNDRSVNTGIAKDGTKIPVSGSRNVIIIRNGKVVLRKEGGVIAVDPKFIRLGSKVEATFFKYVKTKNKELRKVKAFNATFKAADTGPDIIGPRIDITADQCGWDGVGKIIKYLEGMEPVLKTEDGRVFPLTFRNPSEPQKDFVSKKTRKQNKSQVIGALIEEEGGQDNAVSVAADELLAASSPVEQPGIAPAVRHRPSRDAVIMATLLSLPLGQGAGRAADLNGGASAQVAVPPAGAPEKNSVGLDGAPKTAQDVAQIRKTGSFVKKLHIFLDLTTRNADESSV